MIAPNVWSAIEHVYKSDDLQAKAQARWAAQAANLFHPHKLELSASAAGACVLEKWASLHELLDLPEVYETQLVKMDGGTMYGCRVATLFAVGYEDLFAGVRVETEVVGEHDGIPAHVEIVIYDDTSGEANGTWMIEVKTSFWGGAIIADEKNPALQHSKEFHILQAAKEALIVSAPGFSILNVYPAATKRGGAPKAAHFIQDDFLTAKWVSAVSREYHRLEAALDPIAPAGDAQEAWRCISCRYSACHRNRNPLNPDKPLPMTAKAS